MGWGLGQAICASKEEFNGHLISRRLDKGASHQAVFYRRPQIPLGNAMPELRSEGLAGGESGAGARGGESGVLRPDVQKFVAKRSFEDCKI